MDEVPSRPTRDLTDDDRAFRDDAALRSVMALQCNHGNWNEQTIARTAWQTAEFLLTERMNALDTEARIAEGRIVQDVLRRQTKCST